MLIKSYIWQQLKNNSTWAPQELSPAEVLGHFCLDTWKNQHTDK